MGSPVAFCAGLAALAMAFASSADAQAPLVLQELRPQRLEPGQCGLFLWSRGEPEMFVMLVLDRPAEARFRLGGRERAFARSNFSGDRLSGIFERLSFTDGRTTIELEVAFDEIRPIRSGALLRGGIVKVVDRDGWETVTPVGGLAACQPEPGAG